MELKRAERRKTKLKMAISSPSGGGKTYSSLLLAKGLTGSWEKIAVIDTENESASLYSDLGAYNVLVLKPPFSPERYIDAIHTCVSANMEVIIIDSMSHEWAEEGGALDINSQSGGRFQDWAKTSPRHRKFISAILQSPCHVIGTMRRKTDYEVSKEENKTVVRKVGLKEVQREGVEYEFTLSFSLDQNHLAKADKDRTGLFIDKPEFKITQETGKIIRDWCDSGISEPSNETSGSSNASGHESNNQKTSDKNSKLKLSTYTATEDQKKILAKAAKEVGITEVAQLRELSGALLGKPMLDLALHINNYLEVPL